MSSDDGEWLAFMAAQATVYRGSRLEWFSSRLLQSSTLPSQRCTTEQWKNLGSSARNGTRIGNYGRRRLLRLIFTAKGRISQASILEHLNIDVVHGIDPTIAPHYRFLSTPYPSFTHITVASRSQCFQLDTAFNCSVNRRVVGSSPT
jgi:hypothetical protein